MNYNFNMNTLIYFDNEYLYITNIMIYCSGMVYTIKTIIQVDKWINQLYYLII